MYINVAKCWRQQKYHMRNNHMHNTRKQQHNSFLMRDYLSKSDKQMVPKLEPFKGWKLGDEKADVSKKFQPYFTDPPGTEILWNY